MSGSTSVDQEPEQVPAAWKKLGAAHGVTKVGGSDVPWDDTESPDSTSTPSLAAKNRSPLEAMLGRLHALNGLPVPFVNEEPPEESPPPDQKPAPW